MRLWFVFFFLFAGCAAQVPQEQVHTDSDSETEKVRLITVPPDKKIITVTPIELDQFTPYAYSPYSDYLLPLLANMSQEPFYQLSNPQLLVNDYQYNDQVNAPDLRKTIYGFKSKLDEQWGYVTTSVGRSPVANAFLVEGSSLGAVYALVLKHTKLCLSTQAKGLPAFLNDRWKFNSSPGFFECTGLTNKSIYKVGSGLPGLLGPYFDEKDTVLVFRSRDQLQQIALALKYQFPQLLVPTIGR